MSDWKEIEDVNQACSPSNGWCGWCGNCQMHAEDLRDRDDHYWQEGWDDV